MKCIYCGEECNRINKAKVKICCSCIGIGEDYILKEKFWCEVCKDRLAIIQCEESE